MNSEKEPAEKKEEEKEEEELLELGKAFKTFILECEHEAKKKIKQEE